MVLMHPSRAAGVRFPLRLKLASAFLLVALIPLLVLGASYLLGGIEASNAAIERGMEDKLRIGGLLWESELRELAVTASTIAGDNLVILNTELGLSQPIGAYLSEWVERGNCSLAVLLDPAGSLIASDEHWYGSSMRIPVPERYISREAPRPALFFSRDAYGIFSAGDGRAPETMPLTILALHPVWDYRQNLIAWALIGMYIGTREGSAGELFMTTLEKRLGAPCIVAGRDRIYYASDELGEPKLPALEPPDPASDEGGAWHSGYLELATPRGRQMAMFAPLPLPNQAEQPLLFLGTVLHVDSFFAARNQALAQMLMVLLATLLAAAVLVFFLSRSLSRPISVMAEGAKAIRQGDFNTRLTVSSHDELGALAAEFNIMTSRLIETIASLRSAEVELKALNAELEAKVEARTIDLASANLELQAANQGLLRTLAELKEAQDKILVSEKLAVLGRLTAGIAHELNTPLAAISVSARLEMKVFSEGFDVLLTIASRLPREALALLEEARSGAAGRIGIPFAADPPRERRSRREAADVLSKAGIAEADSLADELSELDLASDVATLSPILAGPAGKDFMTLLRGVVGAYRAARIIEDAVEKASRVVAALRTYSRGGEDDAPVRVELAPLVQDVSGLCASRIHRNVELKISVPPGLEAFARREYLSQTCLNILINALQAVGESGTVEIEARKEDDTVLLLFTDTGPGIPARLQPRIFEPFFTTKLSGEGTGLGLDIARRLARADGGDIYFESQPGRTVFTVRLPAPSTPRIRM